MNSTEDEIEVEISKVGLIRKDKVFVRGLIGGEIAMDIERADELAKKILDAIRNYKEEA